MISTSFPGFHSPDASTQNPLEMLSACHDRVERQCQTLLRLCEHLDSHGTDTDAQQAAAAVLRYFETSARHHHADEERDLFPALHAAAKPTDVASVKVLTRSLEAEHRQLESAWDTLRPILKSLAGGSNALLSRTSVTLFVQSYERHLNKEETELLPLAERMLDQEALGRLGHAMRTRRGLTDPD